MTFWPIEFWYWWIAAVVLIVIEMFMPGTFFLWMGVAAGVVGFVLLADPALSLEFQLLIFAVLSVGAVAGWQIYLRRYPPESDEPSLNRRGSQYVGRTFALSTAIVNGVGKINVDDTTWKVTGPDLPDGARVRVTAVQGTVLAVEPAASEAQER
jgi:membrane protein implicated in regulation of membrane protease activity